MSCCKRCKHAFRSGMRSMLIVPNVLAAYLQQNQQNQRPRTVSHTLPDDT